MPDDTIEFTAEYINSTDGTPINGECNITFDDNWGTWYTMDFDNTDYNYSKSFAAAGMHAYNVSCSNASFVTLEANDTKVVVIQNRWLKSFFFGIISSPPMYKAKIVSGAAHG